MLSLISIGVFYFFMSYASVVGWGSGDMASFANNANPYYVLGHSLWGAGWWLVIFALTNCAVAVGIACTNSASRVMYTMGRAGTFTCEFREPASRTSHPCGGHRRGASHWNDFHSDDWAFIAT